MSPEATVRHVVAAESTGPGSLAHSATYSCRTAPSLVDTR